MHIFLRPVSQRRGCEEEEASVAPQWPQEGQFWWSSFQCHRGGRGEREREERRMMMRNEEEGGEDVAPFGGHQIGTYEATCLKPEYSSSALILPGGGVLSLSLS